MLVCLPSYFSTCVYQDWNICIKLAFINNQIHTELVAWGGVVFNVNHYGDWLPISKIVHWEDFHFCWLKSKITIDFKSLNSGSGCASSPWRRVARRPQAHFWVQLWDFGRHCLGHHGAPWSLPSNCSANEDENKVSRRLCSWLLVSSVNDVRCF